MAIADIPLLCTPHFERNNVEKPAAHVIAGLPMCEDCYKGKDLIEEPRAYKSGSKQRLTEERIAAIRERLMAGEKGRVIAIEFGVCMSTVWDIKNKRRAYAKR